MLFRSSPPLQSSCDAGFCHHVEQEDAHGLYLGTPRLRNRPRACTRLSSRPQRVPGSLLGFTQDESALGTRLREEPTHRGALAARPPGPQSRVSGLPLTAGISAGGRRREKDREIELGSIHRQSERGKRGDRERERERERERRESEIGRASCRERVSSPV